MDQLICSKCNTPNKEGVDKCINCGFVFSNQKMQTVGKYIGEIGESPLKNTLVEGDHFNSKPTVLEDSEEMYIHFNADPISASFENNEDHEINSTERLQNVQVNNTLGSEQISDTESLCSKCGYILSAASLICPSCGHNNKPVSKTVAMPIKNVTEQAPIEQKESHHLEITSAHHISSRYGDIAKTVAESSLEYASQSALAVNPIDDFATKKTIREENDLYNANFSNSSIRNEQINKSPIRLEAVYLGQDADQNMVINIPIESKKIDINRSSVDESDSTISASEHACIYKEGDHWKIQNKASNKAVFVQVNDEVIIKNGDIIMLGGDKFYVFIDEIDQK